MSTLQRAAAISSVIAAIQFTSQSAKAAWDPINGLKTDNDFVTEPSSFYTANQLLALGGTLNFSNSVQINGQVIIQEQNGWTAPTVIVNGTFNSTGSFFQVSDFSTLNVPSGSGTVQTFGGMTISNGSSATIGNLVDSGDALITDPLTNFHAKGSYSQNSGSLTVQNGATFTVDSAITFQGNQFNISNGTLSSGNLVGGVVQAAGININNNSHVSVANLNSSGDVFVNGFGTQVAVAGNYSQTAGVFRLDSGASVITGGSFSFTGTEFDAAFGSSLSSPNLSHSTVQSIFGATITGGSSVQLGALSTFGPVTVADSGSILAIDNSALHSGGPTFVLSNNALVQSFSVDASNASLGPTFLGYNGGPGGVMTMTNGTLAISGLTIGGSIFGQGASSNLNLSSSAVLNVTNGLTVYSGSNIQMTGGTLSTDSATIANATNSISQGGQLIIGPGSLVLAGNLSPAIQLASASSTAGVGLLKLSNDVSFTGVAGTAAITTDTANASPGVVDLNAATRTFTVSDGTAPVDMLISAAIQNGGLIKAGSGTLLLSGSNLFSSAVTAAVGTLQLGSSSALSGGENVNVTAGATLDLNGNNQLTSPTFINGTGVGGIGALVNNSATSSTQQGQVVLQTNSSIGGSGAILLSGGIGGAGGLTKVGTGMVTISSAASMTGGVAVNAGTLRFTANGTYTGGISISGGTLSVSADGQLGNSANSISLTNGTLEASSNFASARSLATSGGTVQVDSGANLAWTGAITGSGTFSKTGPGAFNLLSASAGTGGVNIFGGTFMLSSSTGALPSVSGIDIFTSGTLLLNSATAAGGQHSSQDRIGNAVPMKFDGGTLTLWGTDNSATTETMGNLIISSGASSVSLVPGSGTGSLSATFAALGTRTAGATIDFSGTNLGTSSKIFINSGVTNGAAIGGWATVNSTDFAKYSTTSGVIPFSGSDYTVNVFTPNTNVKLDSAVTSPPVPGSVGTVSIKTLNISASSSSVAVNQNASTTLTLTNGGLIKTGGSSATISGGTLTSTSGELDISVTGAPLTISSLLSGSFILTERGTGTLTLNGANANNYSGFTLINGALNLNATNTAIPGDLIINGGTVTSQSNNQLSSATKVTINAGTWDLNGKTESIAQLTNNGGSMLTHGGNLTVSSGVTLNGGITTIGSTLSSAAALTVSGGSNEVLSDGLVTTGSLIFLGNNNPAVQIDADNSLHGTLNLIGAGLMSFTGLGTAQISAANTGSPPTLGTLDLQGGTHSINIAQAASTLIISTRIANGAINVTGGGTLQLNAANTYAGGTTISTGAKLIATNPTALGAAGSTITFAGGSLALRSDSGTQSFSYNTTAGTAVSTSIDIDRVTPLPGTSAGTFTIGNATLGSGSAGFNVTGSNNGLLQIGNATLQYNASAPGPAIINNAVDLTIAGTLQQRGAPGGTFIDIIKNGIGKLTFSGATSTFGNLNVAAGTALLVSTGVAIPHDLSVGNATVRLLGSNEIAATSSISLNAATGASVLDLNGNNNTLGSLNFLAGGSLITGAGTATLAGNVAFTGISGTGSIAGNLNLGSATRTFNIANSSSGAGLQIDATIAGPVGFTKSGNGTMYLTGSNTFTGNIVVSGGILRVNADAALGNASNVITLNNGALQSAASISHPIVIAGSGGYADAESTDVMTWSSSITGNSGLYKLGAGTLVLGGNNPFTGGFVITAGAVQFTSDTNLGATGQIVTLTGGTLSPTTSFTSSRPINFSFSTAGISPSAGSTFTLNGSSVFSWNANGIVDSGTVDLERTAAATVVSATSTLTISPGATVIDGGTGDSLSDGTHFVSVINNSTTSFNVTAGSKKVSAITGVGNTNISTGATLSTAFVRQSQLAVNGTGKLFINAQSLPRNDSATVSVLSGLTLGGSSNAWTSTLDLNDSDLVVHGGNLGTITNQIKSGLNTPGTLWAGSGITSTAAKNNATHLTALGVVQNVAGFYSTFDSQSVAAGDVLVKYTYFGDSNLDGIVDGSDYSLIDNGFNRALTGWINGDYNYSGNIDGSDYSLIDNSFNAHASPLAVSASELVAVHTSEVVSTVPEPSCAILIGMGAVSLLNRRRK